ncbi:MAG: tetraacyldisaccharide 4'-kinase [Fibrobacterota bacterium]
MNSLRLHTAWHKHKKGYTLPGIPVISIGGISAGGTGKTPLVSLIAAYIEQKGCTPILLSRGYGRKTKKTRIVSPDEAATWHCVGDEPLMLKKRHPGLWLCIGANRRKAAMKVLERNPHRPVFIMDDGFQHIRLNRDLDIVTLPENIFSDHLIPAGRMREPLDSLSRADIICIFGDKTEKTAQKLKKSFPAKTVLRFTSEATEWVAVRQGEKQKFLFETMSLFSGIARPHRFLKSAKNKCTGITEHRIFPDHHPYGRKDYILLNSMNNSHVGTTEKDFIRLNIKKLDKRKKFWYLTTEVINETDNNTSLYEKIDKIL